MAVWSFNTAGGKNGCGFFQAGFSAIMQMNGSLVVSCGITPFRERGAVKSA